MKWLHSYNWFCTLQVFLFLVFYANSSKVQKTYFGEEPVSWENNKPLKMPADLELYQSSDLVILSDKAQFNFYSSNNEKIIRNIIVKINTAKGLEKIQSYRLPESFDQAYDINFYKQGRKSKIKIPYISEYHINKLAARKFSSGKWSAVPFKNKYETVNWIKASGEFANDNISVFNFQGLSIGDVVEIYYESGFNSNYGSNLFYFNSVYPKLTCEYLFRYKVSKKYLGYSFVFPVNIKDSLIEKAITDNSDYIIREDKITLHNLKGINYPNNSNEGKMLPHVFADFRFVRIVSNSYPSGDGGRIYDFDFIRPKNFEWLIISDTNNRYMRVYDKQFTTLRKFVSFLPPIGSDSSNKVFFKALCDTFNNFRYISSNQLFYNESNLYDIYSSEHLMKRRLVEHSIWKLYQDILNDNKIFYYVANVQDKRYGEHDIHNRAHYFYEGELIAIPSKNSYIYFMPRYEGIKYHLNELPFYFEGSLLALEPKNFQEDTKNKQDKFFKFIKTHKGTFNENTRTENATVKISIDSLKAGLIIKESLSGQFSTVLRHLYLNEYIDSTIAPYYFKKCTDKPNALKIKIKLSSSISEFPFRYTFNCSENIPIQNAQSLNLRNWFSFLISKTIFPERPTHDYYFDFDFSDSYNFLLDFNAPVEISNISEFSKKINNDYFELESEIVKNADNAYLLKVKLLVKERKIPLEKMDLLEELIMTLDALNNFSLLLVKQ